MTYTAVTPESTVYVMLAVYDPVLTKVYVVLPDMGTVNFFRKVCVTDAALSRPDGFSTATTTTPVVMLE